MDGLIAWKAGSWSVISIRQRMRTVVVQDRSRLYRESLQLLLPSKSAVQTVQVVADADSLVQVCQVDRFDGVVYEAVGVPWDMREVANRIRRTMPDVVLVGTYPHEHRRIQPVDGVTFVSRSSTIQTMVNALHGVAVGLTTTAGRSERSSVVSDSLTRREFQVLALISGGLTSAQMAARLGISVKTVEGRRQSLFAKLGVQNQSHAIAVAIRTGLLGSGSLPQGDP
jgi:DNA-binding NarL/FixJ family response regulator